MAEVMKVYANFHTHTTHSDGVYTPREIAEMAAKEGYRALAITDHDTFTGNRFGAEACRELGLDGIEVWHGLLSGEARREALRLAREYDLYVSGGSDHDGLCGGEYKRYADPTQCEFYFPECTLGTTEYFAEELLTRKKKQGRREVMDALLADDTLWERTK